MPNRQFPGNPSPVPAHIVGYQVMAVFRIPAREGEVPDLAVVIGRDADREPDRAFVVWDVAVRSGEWTASSGAYDLPWEDAVTEFTERIRMRS